MPNLVFTEDELKVLAMELKEIVVPAIIEELKFHQDLPPLLTRKQFMELTGIKDTKCAELFNRADFPVIRELGHPRVPTKLFLEWVYANTDNANLINIKSKEKDY
ncbi:DNA-binding protein [Halalkalibacterium halodurans]|uniref:DNA-binding protein n=1 Tax=Halalkalibacterium halodurans TaxID=86665 RepID=UPI002AA9B4D7|nr:DNA-binding protein [Halalkalibacterium halodurans]MDY7223987.1 DNA-binding protein [Halalkalibacterium halodurans]MDY7243208.1 DNA-binding protein [Halalkalibacterium halodurans]